MNIKDCLNYHRYCMICNSKMKLSSPELVGITLVEKDNSVHIRTGHKEVGLELFHDGTYKKSNQWSESYSQPLIVKRGCPVCKGDFKMKSRSLGFTTNSDKSSLCHSYSFTVNTTGDSLYNKTGTYVCELFFETIKFSIDDILYRVFTDFEKNQSEVIKSILPEPGLRPGTLISSLDFPEPKVLNLQLPLVKTDKIFNKEQMVEKIDKYILFS